MAGELIVVALGGNAIKQADEEGTTEQQLANVDATAAQIAGLVSSGYRVVVTHGNGPQAGSLLIQQEEAASLVPPQSLYVCGAMTQGQIGWMLQNRLAVHLRQEGSQMPVCTMITQVEVRADDPDFDDPSKPVGPFYDRETAERLRDTRGYQVREVKPGHPRGWRRVVPSPQPVDIVERDPVRSLVTAGTLVVASGGGGIPVQKHEDGSYSGVDAVVDKDRAGLILAQAVGAERFLILTDVERVALHFGTPQETYLDRLTVSEAEEYFDHGHFLSGSMGPKVQAAVAFARWSGEEAVISSLHSARDALAGKTGTHIVP
jgi:carbamate kinase